MKTQTIEPFDCLWRGLTGRADALSESDGVVYVRVAVQFYCRQLTYWLSASEIERKESGNC